MTKEQIVAGLRRAETIALSISTRLETAIEKIEGDDWSSADGAVCFALGDVDRLVWAASDDSPTLRQLFVEIGREAVNAADPDGEGGLPIPKEIADSLGIFDKPENQSPVDGTKLKTAFGRGYWARFRGHGNQHGKSRQWRCGWLTCDSELRNEEELSHAAHPPIDGEVTP